jgi:hypothetical protein
MAFFGLARRMLNVMQKNTTLGNGQGGGGELMEVGWLDLRLTRCLCLIGCRQRVLFFGGS